MTTLTRRCPTHYAESWTTAETVTSVALRFGAFTLVVLLGLVALVLAHRWQVRAAAVAVPVLMLAGLAVLTPLALDKKMQQYTSTPQCIVGDDGGPGAQAAAESQEAFDSIEHVGHFGGGGSVGTDGCDRQFQTLQDVDVLQHYREALPRAGWTVVEDDDEHLRAERDAMAFEVAVCGDGGVVWAGRTSAVRMSASS